MTETTFPVPFTIGQMVHIVEDDNKEFIGLTGQVVAIQNAFWTRRGMFPIEVEIQRYDFAVKQCTITTRWYRIRDLREIT